MNINKISIALLLMAIIGCTFTTVFAEDATLEDGTNYAIPEGYSILKTENGIVTLATEDQTQVITVTDVDVKSAEDGKQAQIDNGANFESEDTITINDVEITQQKFTKDGLNLYGYLFKVGDKDFSVTAVNNDAQWNVEDSSNPVNTLITSLTSDSSNQEESE